MKETMDMETIKPKPTVCIDATLLPEMKHWRIGKKYNIALEVEQLEIGRNEWEENGPIRGRFRIISARAIDPPKQSDLKDKIREKSERY